LRVKERCREYLKQLKESFFHFVFPSRCLHCEFPLAASSAVFCENCASLLTVIDPRERCEYCFEESPTNTICRRCLEFPLFYSAVASVFDYEGPPASLIKKMKYEDQPYLARGAGSFLFTQWLSLNWPLPDMIIPVPQTLVRWFERGYNQSELLAEELGKLLGAKICQPMRRLHGDFSQANLNLGQRQQLRDGCFVMKKGFCVKDKVILVVDDVLTSGATLRQCALTLARGYPARMYALTLCRTSIG